MKQPLDTAAIFERAVTQTRARSPISFDPWFGSVQFDALTDGVLSLRAQNDFVLRWVEDHFIPSLATAIREETGWSVQTAWTVDPQLTRPVVARSETAPARPRPVAVRPPSMAPPAEPPASTRPDRGVPPTESPLPNRSERHALPEGIEPRHTFGCFVVGPSNQLAHAAALGAAGSDGRRYNPLFLCGATGLGKTHLLHAIAHELLERQPDARVLYVSAERFMNEFIASIQHQRMADFRTRYREQCDLLLVDDIQFLAGRDQTQEEFFHTFNALHSAGRQIVLTSDKYPQALKRMEERLVSRFAWGLVADLQPPELETRVAIVKKKASVEGFEVPDDAALALAQAVRSNVRELEGTLVRLAAKSSLLGGAVDAAFVRSELGGAQRAPGTSLDEIQRLVCHHFRLRSSDLVSKDRHKSIAFARHVAMYLCKQRLRASYPEIGRAFGGRDHTTVMNAVRKIDAQRELDAELRGHIEELERKLAEG
jgi:chromosomal replication initiator protein